MRAHQPVRRARTFSGAGLMLLLGWGSMAGAQSVGISTPSHGELLLNTSAFYRGAPDYGAPPSTWSSSRDSARRSTPAASSGSALINRTADKDPGVGYYDTCLPDLHDATEILIGGESAALGLVRHHLDRLRDWLTTEIPGVVVRGVTDAGFTPEKTDPTITWPATTPTDYRDYLLNVYEPVVRGFWGADDSALDQSCLDPVWAADHKLVGSHPQVCYDTTYTQLNHVTTPDVLADGHRRSARRAAIRDVRSLP